MHKLITEDEKTKKYYLKEDDMDSKKKKTFDLVLNISENKKVNLITVEQMNQFIEIYKDIIDKYDQEYKEIYFSRFTDAIGLAIAHVALKIELNEKMTILGE
jgi:galactose-1-phosphate uridylyltransferase